MLICTILMAVSGADPARVKAAQPPDKIETEIRSLEARRLQALTHGNVQALDQILSQDLVYTHASGWRQNKLEFLGSIRSGELKYHTFTTDDVRMHLYGNTALLSGHASTKVNAKGQELDVSLLFLEVYVKLDSGWQLVAWQSTRSAQ